MDHTACSRCLMHCLRGRPSAIFKVFAEKVPVIEVCRPILYLAMQLFVFECLLGCLITWTTSSQEITSCDGTCRLSHYSMKWTAAGETVTGDGSRLRGSKRLKTTTPATAQGPQHGQRCNPKPTRNQSMMKAPCKRSQKLGDKITVLQQLVSAEAAFRHRDAAFTEDHWCCLGTL
ncbi:uncharacterized protein [Miscanthus floridulus]|uniref:uncharacterized protein isoform X2 n=1 Tax=Miscanthus floridulus TaxID=154761 RepID=UPI00345B472E